MDAKDLKGLFGEVKTRMDGGVEHVRKELSNVRTGRASTGLLDTVHVEAYGSKMPLNQLAGLSIPEPNLIVAQPYDPSTLAAIEKAIRSSDLGLNPASDGKVIRIPIPMLTDERRKELSRHVHKLAEEGRNGLRQVRRDEQRHADTRGGQPFHGRGDAIEIAGDFQSTLRGDLLALLGHQAAVLRAHADGDVEHFGGHAHLEVHARLQQRSQGVHVAILDVPTVFAQVQGDVVGAGLLSQQRRVHRVRVRSAARLTHGGHVIDVDAQFDASGHGLPRRAIDRATVRVRSSRPSRQ